MLIAPSIETIAEHLRANLELLEELHVLSQTQTLLLENSDLRKLGLIVDAKEALVAKITEAEKQLAALLAATGPGLSGVQEFVTLKEQALQLIERISAVERQNRVQLEALRADLIRRSQTLQEDRRIQEAYGKLS